MLLPLSPFTLFILLPFKTRSSLRHREALARCLYKNNKVQTLPVVSRNSKTSSSISRYPQPHLGLDFSRTAGVLQIYTCILWPSPQHCYKTSQPVPPDPK